METTDLIKSVSIENLLQQRNALLERFQQMQALAAEMKQLSAGLGDSYPPRYEWEFGGHRHSLTDIYRGEAEESKEQYRAAVDSLAWRYLMKESGNLAFMDAKARQAWEEGLKKEIPELTPANIKATFEGLHDNREDMFNRGIINVFRGLSWDYKTNSPFKLGKKIIVEYLTNSYYSHASDKLDDLYRAFHVLDGKPAPEYRNGITCMLNENRRQTDHLETAYFHLKWYGNGNGHVTFKRLDLVERMNKIVAAHFPFHIPQDNRRAA